MLSVGSNLLLLTLLGILLLSAHSKSDGVGSQEGKLQERELKDERGGRTFLVRGDILLTRDEASHRQKRQAQRRNASNENLWTNGVKYVFDVKASEEMKAGFIRAAKAWEKDTCINFTLVETVEKAREMDYLYVTYDENETEACMSHVGKFGGYQPIYLGKGCEAFPHAAHEVGHALGMYHTQTRHDRDKYIRLLDGNIEKEYAEQFAILTEQQNENYGFPYDYGSIMHIYFYYYSGSAVEEPWMVPTDPNYKTTMGSPFISFIDLFMMNKHYNCTDNCPPEKSANCENGGFPHPRRCNECICPGGYGGKLCNRLPEDCQQGKEVKATPTWNEFQEVFKDPKNDGTYSTCTYWITAPDNKKIEVKVVSVHTKATIGCARGGVEIKANANHTLTGYRYCVEPEDEITIKSNSSRVPVILYTGQLFATVANLEYRYVD